MAERGLLHKRRLDEFRAFLAEKGIEHRLGRGEFEVMQVKWPSSFRAIYKRAHAPEHVSVPIDLLPLVEWFFSEKG